MKSRASANLAVLQALGTWLFGLLMMSVGMAAHASVIVTAIGNPLFTATDFHLFAAPVGTATSGYVEFTETQQRLLPLPNHALNPVLGIGPGAAHAGPYDREMADGVAANGYVESTRFTTDQYSKGSGVYFVFMLLPGAGSVTGSSPDFASGPILPLSLFPLSLSGGTYTNGTLNDALADFQVPALSDVAGFAGIGGHSHIPFFFVDNFDFASSPVTGNYEYRLSILDASGNGYQVVAGFEVVPEPASWLLVLSAGLAVTVSARSRQAQRRLPAC